MQQARWIPEAFNPHIPAKVIFGLHIHLHILRIDIFCENLHFIFWSTVIRSPISAQYTLQTERPPSVITKTPPASSFSCQLASSASVTGIAMVMRRNIRITDDASKYEMDLNLKTDWFCLVGWPLTSGCDKILAGVKFFRQKTNSSLEKTKKMTMMMTMISMKILLHLDHFLGNLILVHWWETRSTCWRQCCQS